MRRFFTHTHIRVYRDMSLLAIYRSTCVCSLNSRYYDKVTSLVIIYGLLVRCASLQLYAHIHTHTHARQLSCPHAKGPHHSNAIINLPLWDRVRARTPKTSPQTSEISKSTKFTTKNDKPAWLQCGSICWKHIDFGSISAFSHNIWAVAFRLPLSSVSRIDELIGIRLHTIYLIDSSTKRRTKVVGITEEVSCGGRLLASFSVHTHSIAGVWEMTL